MNSDIKSVLNKVIQLENTELIDHNLLANLALSIDTSGHITTGSPKNRDDQLGPAAANPIPSIILVFNFSNFSKYSSNSCSVKVRAK